LTLDSWVEREVTGLVAPRELMEATRDFCVAGTLAKQVLGVRPGPSQPEQHRVYIWKHGTINPRLVTIQPADGEPAAETMEALLDRFVAGIAPVAGETATSFSGPTSAEANSGNEATAEAVVVS
jgi:hypothetical protein